MEKPRRNREFLRAYEVAKSLNVSRKTLYNWLREGRIPEPERNPLTNYPLWTVKDVEIIRNAIGAGEPE